MKYTEIKTRYEGKCSKCGRVIKIGWQAVFSTDKDNKKELFCQPCGKPFLTTPESVKPPGMELSEEESLLLHEMYGQVKLNTDLLSTIALQIDSIKDKLENMLIEQKTEKKG